MSFYSPQLRKIVTSIGITLLTVISLSAAPIQATYYAAPNGSGTLGTKEAPLLAARSARSCPYGK